MTNGNVILVTSRGHVSDSFVILNMMKEWPLIVIVWEPVRRAQREFNVLAWISVNYIVFRNEFVKKFTYF